MTFDKYKSKSKSHLRIDWKKKLKKYPVRTKSYKKGVFFPKFRKGKVRSFSGKRYSQSAFSSDKDAIDHYRDSVLQKNAVKYRITKEGNKYQVWIRKKS